MTKIVLRFLLVLLAGFSCCLTDVWGQTDLVRWNGASDGFNPNILVSHITASNITSTGATISNNGQYNQFFQTGGWPNPLQNGGYLNTSRYVEFTVTPNANYQINLSQFNFEVQMDGGNANFEVRYSKDFSQGYSSFNGTIDGNWVAKSGSLSGINPVMPGQTVYIRLYVYNTYNSLRIKHSWGNITGPTITGTVSLASPPVATNDNATTAQNFPVNIEILDNDTYSTLSAITITQQPAHGQNIGVNGLTNVTYTPNNNYTGTDNFKYTLTDENGTSDEAMVNITVSAPVAPTAVEDAASVIQNQTTNINVLANDTPGSGAFDYVTVVTNPAHGTVQVNPDNTVTYTPNNNYTGADNFQYKVTNVHNMTSNTVTVSINVYSNPVDLVKWNNANLTPTVVGSNITANSITTGGDVTIQNFDWTGFRINNFHNGVNNTINYSKYLDFRITPNSGYKILLSQFKFRYSSPNDNGPTKLQIRYSTDPGFPSNGTLLGSEQTLTTGSDHDLILNFPANYEINQILYLRVYLYGHPNNGYTDFLIRNPQTDLNNPNQYQGPTITGIVSHEITADPTDLGLTQTISNPTPNTGDQVTFTIIAENHGPNAATGASVTDLLPPGFSYVSSSASVGSYDNATGIWTIGSLTNAAAATLQITATMQAGGPHTNTATVTHNGSDPVSGNNSASVTPDNVCAGCTNTISGSTITVNAGEVYCLYSGSWSGGVTMNGGTICIAEGATFETSYISGNLSGTVINRGTMTFNLNAGGPHNITFENYGLFNTTNLQNFSGTINNAATGRVQMASGQAGFLSGAAINNYGKMYLNANSGVDCHNANIINYDSFVVSENFYLDGGSLDNKASGVVSLSMSGGSTAIQGQTDNSGLMLIRKGNSDNGGISAVVNNYGIMRIYDAVVLGSATYLTNDSLIEFININSVEFQGPMLQNNGRLRVTAGNLSLNSSISQMVNNGIVIVSGSVSHNIAGSKVVNTCRIVAGSYFVGNGTTENKGLIWVMGEFKVEGMLSEIKNDTLGFIRGADFRNSGKITGYGSYYFTGTTNFQSAGTMIGDDANKPILFFDNSQTGTQIFDVYVADNPPVNTERPALMVPIDTTNYVCGAPPSSAGYPPTVGNIDTTSCTVPPSIVFHLSDHVSAHEIVDGKSFTIDYGSIKLFDHNDPDNGTNNTSALHVANVGNFTANLSNGNITFAPDPAFTGGEVVADYKISNSWTGIPPVHPSPKAQITMTIACYGPAVSNVDTSFCGAADSIVLNLGNRVTAHDSVNNFSFSLQWGTLKLFDSTNPGNPGNGTGSVHIDGQGTFTVTQTTPGGKITFYPDSGFTGTAVVQYQVSNTWNKNAQSFTSENATITVTESNIPTPDITVSPIN